jgi:hypothetical protein
LLSLSLPLPLPSLLLATRTLDATRHVRPEVAAARGQVVQRFVV